MQLILKATNVKHPGARGGQFWIDEKGQARYDAKPTGEKRPHKYLALVVLADGTEKYLRPKDDELDENGQVIGGQPKIREIINRELFGEYGFKTDGTFWQKKGILVEYKTRTTARGKIEVDPIDRHDGYTHFEFRDSSVARAYGVGEGEPAEAGLPKKITSYKVEATTHEAPPSKEKIELPEGVTSDKPPIEEMSIHTVPPRKPQTEVALGDKLTEKEDPVAIANAYLAETFRMRKPSQAKTERGQQKAREEREGQYDHVTGHRKIKPLPVWAIAKYDSPEDLQHALSRDGQPLTTLITLGMWDPENKSKRFREQLLKEWMPFLRRWARRFASVYASTDSYRKFDKLESSSGEKAQRDWLYDRERDLFNEGVTVLLSEADSFLANDEPRGGDSRFDLKAGNAIKNHLEKKAKQAAVEIHGATHLEDLGEDDAYHAPKMISPREQFELRHYEPQAVKILSDLTATLPHEVRAAFLSRLWIDDHHNSPDASEEHAWNERRAARMEKHGESNLHWGRPWIRSKASGTVAAMSDKLADVEVKLRGGKTEKLGSMRPQHQMYYLEKWFNEALEHVQNHLKTSSGKLTPDGAIVDHWLRLESKLARINTKEITDRVQHKTVQMPVKLDKEGKPVEPVIVEHNRAHEHPSVTFFKQPGSNRELAQRLGIVDDLDVPLTLRNMNLPRHQEDKLKRVASYHDRLQENLKYVGDLGPLHDEQHATTERHRNMGSWYRSPSGSMEWHEENGVAALHAAAVKLHNSKGEDKEAVTAYTSAINALGADHPMVEDYNRRLHTLGADVPTNADLAAWKARSHSAYREQANRLHIIEFAQEQRNMKKSITDLREAFAMLLGAYDDLRKAFQ